ncbi:DHH family phosphoesterase [Bacillus sp. 165]|uniref:DHH family phosphoesterase n=1 Tax=Bacillus sp. 165 TaxID=1529117 RepID=UPI001ADC206C|nr:DHH family phosphoesterase [Bacillus sp. 165]MBO9129206.1 oligoribonuclease [Bacillus sp. 165]
MYRLYTHNDLDGVGCAILATLAFKDKADIRYNSVNSLDDQIEKFLEKKEPTECLYITDLSVHKDNEEKLQRYFSKKKNVQLIDHHKSALHLDKYDWANVQVQYEDGRLASATSLFYDYLLEHNMLEDQSSIAEFVELVRQYDTWEWDKNDNYKAKQLNDLFFLLSIEEFHKKMTARLQMNDHFSFDEFEEKILEMESEKIERYMYRKKREMKQTFIGDYCVGVVYAESYHSELGNELGKLNPHLDYIAIVNMGSKKLGFRTIHDTVDVSEVAAQLGGGGHAKASGCSLTEEAYRDYVSKPFHLEPVKQDAEKNVYNIKASAHGALYENRQEDKTFIYPTKENTWKIEHNGNVLKETFSSFQEAERHVKRFHASWLVHDEIFVAFLLHHVSKSRVHSNLSEK